MTQGDRLHRSRFVVEYERDGLVAIVHELMPVPLFITKEQWLSPCSQVQDELLMRGLMIYDDGEDAQRLAAARQQVKQQLDRPSILYLMLAQGCNFACRYCPIPGLAAQYGEKLLSFADAKNGIDMWANHIAATPPDHEPYYLIFYGGEPLLNRSVLVQLLDYIATEKVRSTLPAHLQLMLCTNGSLIDAEIARKLAAHGVTVALGLDGPSSQNDLVRVTVDAMPTGRKILDAMSLLLREHVRVVVSTTITPQNVEQIDTYHGYFKEIGVSQFGFNLMKGEALRKALGSRSVEWYCAAAARGVAAGLRYGEHFEYQLAKRLAALRGESTLVMDCPCYGNQIVVQADGQVTNCPFRRHEFGHVTELPKGFRIAQTDAIQEWRKRVPVLNVSSRNGVLQSGGGCAWSVGETDDLLSEDRIARLFAKEIMHELIWAILPDAIRHSLRERTLSYWTPGRIGSVLNPASCSDRDA